MAKAQGKRHEDLADDERHQEYSLLLNLFLAIVLRVEHQQEANKAEEEAQVDEVLISQLEDPLLGEHALVNRHRRKVRHEDGEDASGEDDHRELGIALKDERELSRFEFGFQNAIL